MDYEKAARLRAATYQLCAAIGAIAVAYGVITSERLNVILPLVPAVFALVMAAANVKTVPPTLPAPEPVEVPSAEDIAAAVVSGISVMPAPVAQPATRDLRSDHGAEVQGVNRDTPLAG